MNTGGFSAIALAVLVGMVIPLQALINARLGAIAQGSLFAATASFLVGTVVLSTALLIMGKPLPSWSIIAGAPWWAWLGGMLGAMYVFSATLLVPNLGAAKLVCLVVFGQIVGAMLLDHFGVLHAAKPIDAMHLAGGALVVVGVMLVVRP